MAFITCIVLLKPAHTHPLFDIPAGKGAAKLLAAATRGDEDGDTYAIVIGISRYKNISPLRFADRDASAFAYYLRNLTGYMVDSVNIRVFLNDDATLTHIADCMSEFLRSDRPKMNDRFIFYFAGHGDIESKIFTNEGLLLLYGAPKKDYNLGSNNQFLSTGQLYRYFFEPLLARKVNVILIADACHAAAGKDDLSGGNEGGKATQLALEGIKLPTKIFSCKSDQSSIEGEQFGGGRGLFSYTFLKGLYGDADDNKDGMITMREIQRHVEDYVPKMAKPNFQDPVMQSEDPFEVFGKVNKKFYIDYVKNENSNPIFLTHTDERSRRESWLRSVFSKAKKDYRRCLQMIENGDVEDAYAFYKAKLDKDSNSVAAIQLKRILSEIYQEEAARIIIPMTENISRIMPDRTSAGIAHYELSRAAELLGPRHYLANYYRARILFLHVLATDLSSRNADIGGAIQQLKTSMQLEPNAPYTYFLTGSLFQQIKQFDSARRYYQFYIDLIPNNSWAHNNMGQVHVEMGNDREAMASFEKAIALDPRGGRTYNNLGQVYLRRNTCAEAIRCFNQSILYWEKSELPYINLATAYELNKQPGEAIKALETGYRINPANERLNLQLAALYFNKRAYQKAAESFEQALRINRGNKAIRQTLGDAYYAIGDLENAYYNFHMAINAEPNNPALLAKYGAIIFKLAKQRNDIQKKPEAALNLAEDYYRMYPKKFEALQLLADVYYAVQDYVQSLPLYKKAYEMKPVNVYVLTGYAHSLFYNKRYQEALLYLKKLAAKGRGKPDLYFNIACCNAALNKKPDFYSSMLKVTQTMERNEILVRTVNARELDAIRTTDGFRTFFQNYYKPYELNRFPYLFRNR